jgi:antitoxin (DNA-binding transcriptional repressor) of toxin-antitoxin stability system
MNLSRAAAGLAVVALAVSTAVPVALASVNCSVYCPPPTVSVGSSNVNTTSSSNSGGLTGTVKSGAKSGQSVQGFFSSVTPQVASQLVAAAKAGAKVNVTLSDTPANRALAKTLEAAGAKVTLTKTSTDVSVALTGTSAYISTGGGVGVQITDKATLDTLKQVLSGAGNNKKFGGVNKNGVITAPGAALPINQVLKTATTSVVVRTGDLNSVMLVDTLANLAKKGVKVTLIVPSSAKIDGALLNTLETHGDTIVQTKGTFTGTAIAVDNTYGFISSGNLNYHGISQSEQVGIAFHGSGAKDLQSALASNG